MSANQQKIDGAAVLRVIRKSGLWEYGLNPEPLADQLEQVKTQRKGEKGLRLAGCLDNGDGDRMLLKLVRKAPEKVIKGLAACAAVLDASEVLIYLPEEEKRLEECLREAAEDTYELGKGKLDIRYGLAEARYLLGGCICHLETLMAVADALDGSYRPGAWLQIERKSGSGDKDAVQKDEPIFVPFGTRLGDVASWPGHTLKAVGFGGHLYGAELLEQALKPELPSGSGVLRLFDQTCCMVEAAKESLEVQRALSCGRCTFCREGLGQLDTRIKETVTGKGDWEGMEVMNEIGNAMSFSCLCSVGRFGAQFVLDSFRLFANEYEDHMKKKRCTAGTCLAFVTEYIDPDKCTGCGKCIAFCPSSCIEGLPGYIFMIEDLECTKCGECRNACPEQAIVRTSGRTPALPDRLTRVGRFKQY